MPSEGNFFQDVTAVAVNYIQHTFRFIADIHPRPIGAEYHAMRQFNALNGLHHLIRCGIHNINRITGAVGDVDSNLW